MRRGLRGRAARRLQLRDVDGLGALVPGLGVIGDLRALGQRLESVCVDAGVVDEEVLAPLVRRDEAEALVVVEPLDGSGCHRCSLLRDVNGGRGRRWMATTAALNTTYAERVLDAFHDRD